MKNMPLHVKRMCIIFQIRQQAPADITFFLYYAHAFNNFSVWRDVGINSGDSSGDSLFYFTGCGVPIGHPDVGMRKH